MRRLRHSFALRLVAGAIVLVVLLVAGVSSFLLVRQHRQTEQSARTTSENRAATIRELLEQITVPEARAAARNLASNGRVVAALRPDAPAGALQALVDETAQSAEAQVTVFDAGGAERGATRGDAVSAVAGTSPLVRAALDGREGSGVTTSPDGPAALVVAVPIRDGATVRGAVVDAVLLDPQLQRLSAVIGYPVVFVPAGAAQDAEVVPAQGGSTRLGGLGPDALPQPGSGAVTDQTLATAAGDQSISLVALTVGEGAPGGAVGVEVPLSAFASDERDAAVTVGLMALIAVTVTSLLAVLFVDRFVGRPVAVLERGVARIAGGDYTTDVPSASEDELGRLALGVNAMRESIAGHARQLQDVLDHLGAVSAALTTTAAGVDTLSGAVATASAAIAGPGSEAAVLRIDGDGFRLVAASPGHLDWPRITQGIGAGGLAAAGAVRSLDKGDRALLLLPLSLESQRVGVIAVCPAPGAQLGVAARTALDTLANNAGIALDHTRLLAQEQDTVRRLRDVERMRRDFLDNVHHELRTPLAAIVGTTEMAQTHWGVMDEAIRAEVLATMATGTRRLTAVIDALLDFTVLSGEGTTLERGPVALRPLVLRAVGAVSERLSGPPRVAFDITVAEGVEVDADAKRLGQVLDALIDNAVKFTPAGGTVTVDAVPGGDRTEIRVSDTGVGIDPDALPRIFEGFYQGETGLRRRFGGMGLGLALVERICVLHGATIAIDSRLDEGTTVHLEWPSSGGASGVSDAVA